MERVWIVMGSTGEYSDRTEWPVVAFTSEEAAKARIAALDVKMQQVPQEWRENRWANEDKIKAHMATLDPGFSMEYTSMEYTGTYYFFYEVPVMSASQ